MVYFHPPAILFPSKLMGQEEDCSYIFFNLQNLLHLGFLALQILMLRMLLALIYSCNPFFKVSVLSKHRIRNCSVIISQTSFWLVILHFYVAVQSALKSLCNDLATSTFWNACELASYICAYIEDVYTFFIGVLKMYQSCGISSRDFIDGKIIKQNFAWTDMFEIHLTIIENNGWYELKEFTSRRGPTYFMVW